MNKLDELKNFIDSMQGDYEKFFVKGKNAAGTRLRKSLQELRRMAQELRNEIQKVRMERKSQKSGSETPSEPAESGENN
ncbi:MAG: histone H1 [Ignavibacteria bacterium]